MAEEKVKHEEKTCFVDTEDKTSVKEFIKGFKEGLDEAQSKLAMAYKQANNLEEAIDKDEDPVKLKQKIEMLSLTLIFTFREGENEKGNSIRTVMLGNPVTVASSILNATEKITF